MPIFFIACSQLSNIYDMLYKGRQTLKIPPPLSQMHYCNCINQLHSFIFEDEFCGRPKIIN